MTQTAETADSQERRPHTPLADGSVAALNARAWELRNTDPHHSLSLSREAHAHAQALADASGCAHSLRTAGYCHAFLGEIAPAQEALRAALDLSRQAGDLRLEGSCLNGLGLTHYFSDEPAAAMEFYALALAARRAAGDAAGEGATLNNIGLIYQTLGDHQACVDHYTRALEVGGDGDPAGRGMTLANIGRVYWEAGDDASALRYHEDSLRLARDHGNLSLEAYAQAGLGVTLLRLGRWDEAEAAAGRALTLARALGKAYEEQEALHTLGRVCARRGRAEEALLFLTGALACAEASADRESEAEIRHSLALAHRGCGDDAQAQSCLERAAALAAEADQKALTAQAHEALAELCERRGDLAGALAHLKTFHAVTLEALSQKAARRTQALLLQMEVEKTQKEAEVHRLRSMELAQMNEALRQANEEKEQLLEELRAQAGELERQATEDGLTGVHNRRYLEGWLAQAFAQARRYASPLTVALADVDHFKHINDRFGHGTGDQVLRRVARLLRGTCRASDVVARYGGEEFVLALPGTSAARARVLCEKIRAATEAYPWHTLHPELRVTVSVGLSDDLTAANHERLLSLADARLYEAKRAGRNRVL